VSNDDAHPLGYQRVDASPDPGALLAAMTAHAAWSATVDLRAWERDRLRLTLGERLLDVGCGLGDAARALADDLGPDGEVIGVDASAAMLDAARSAWDAACPARFVLGDAQALDLPSGSVDVARSERVLQWLLDPQAAVTELARVLRPGGRLSLIDTDWGSLRLDIGADDLADAVRRTMTVERGRHSRIGGRLPDLAGAAGFRDIVSTEATQVWSRWDPDSSPAPDGCLSMQELAQDVVDAGELDAGEVERFVITAHEAARQGRFSMSLTMHAVVAVRE
jgi:SAM-dependent methyltransferase